MAVQKLSSKNQIVLPKEARQAMGVRGGDELLIVVKDDLCLLYTSDAAADLPCVALGCRRHIKKTTP